MYRLSVRTLRRLPRFDVHVESRRRETRLIDDATHRDDDDDEDETATAPARRHRCYENVHIAHVDAGLDVEMARSRVAEETTSDGEVRHFQATVREENGERDVVVDARTPVRVALRTYDDPSFDDPTFLVQDQGSREIRGLSSVEGDEPRLVAAGKTLSWGLPMTRGTRRSLRRR